MKLYSLDSILTFGKYKDKTVHYVLKKDCLYVSWCVGNLEHFVLEENAIHLFFEQLNFNKHILPQYIEELISNGLHPNNITPESIKKFESTIKNNYQSLFSGKLQNFSLLNKKSSKFDYYHDYDALDDKYSKNSRYDFLRDVLGGDSSAIWNID